mgnify:FL=1
MLLDLQPATVHRQGAYQRLTGSARILVELEDATEEEWSDALRQPTEFLWLTEFVSETDDGDRVAQAIRDGKAIAVSDGSFKLAIGTASWVLQGEDHADEVKGRCRVPGPEDWQSAYRSELCGLLGSIYFATTLAKHKGITTGKIRVGCDGLSAIQQLREYKVTQTPMRKHFDLISAIRRLMRDSPIEIELFHIKGHQDDVAFNVLDRFETLNVVMDSQAKAHWTMVQDDDADFARHERIPGEGWPLWLGFEKSTGEIRTPITEHVHSSELEQYWVTRNRFPVGRATGQYVDWSATAHAMRNSTANRRQWVTKHVSGMAAVGKWMLRRKEWTHDTCPRCGEENETTLHVLLCQDPGATAQWKKSLDELNTWMKKHKTHPGIRAAVISHLKAWQTSSPGPTTHGQAYYNLSTAIANQNEVGWQAFIEGCPSHGWRESQQQYYEFLRSRKTGLRWLSALIRKLWQVAWDMWEHRNGVLHHKEQGQAALERMARIREEFEEGSRELDRDTRLLFRPGLQKVLRYKAGLQLGWLARVETARERAAVRQGEMDTGG